MKMTALLLFGLLAFGQAMPQVLPSTESALSADPKGWVDLLADRSLKDWTRVPLGAGKTLPAGDVNAPSPWKLDPTGTILVCDGDKSGHEMFRYGQEYGDHVLHVEWRFAKLEGEPGYNSGVYVRASADGSIWHQAQTGPTGGFLFGNTLVNGAPQRVNLRDAMKENRVKPAGEWNTYEITAKGPAVSLWVNGAVTSTLEKLEVPRGYVGFEAEGYRIEFRNVKVKRLD
jgi:hypothetical protein